MSKYHRKCRWQLDSMTRMPKIRMQLAIWLWQGLENADLHSKPSVWDFRSSIAPDVVMRQSWCLEVCIVDSNIEALCRRRAGILKGDILATVDSLPPEEKATAQKAIEDVESEVLSNLNPHLEPFNETPQTCREMLSPKLDSWNQNERTLQGLCTFSELVGSRVELADALPMHVPLK